MKFPISDTSPVTYAGPPPAETDVVVIGGGVIGVCTALFLAEAGQRVVLLEKGRIAELGEVWRVFGKPQHDATKALLAPLQHTLPEDLQARLVQQQ